MRNDNKENKKTSNLKDETTKDVTLIASYLSRTTISDSLKAEQFKDYLFTMISEGTDKIMIDLSHCDFIDSTFIGMLITSVKKDIANKKTLRLTIDIHNDSAVFCLTRIDKIFKSFSDLNDEFDGFYEN